MTHLSKLPPEDDEIIPEEPFPDDRAKWDAWVWLVKGASEALDVRLAAHTNGSKMGIVNLEANTRPPMVERAAFIYPQDLVEAFRHRIRRIEEWPEDPGNWGPDPWRDGREVHRD